MSRPLAIVLVLLCAPLAKAHHNPSETIALLSEEIARTGGSADLFYQRATEYRQLRLDAEAEADFRQVATLRPDDPEAYKALAQILLWQEKTASARSEALRAIERASDARVRAACRILLAQIEQSGGHEDAALAACGLAFKDHPEGEIDWFLLRAELQQALRLDEARIEGLKSGHEVTGSIVLRNAWIDAQLDAGQAREVLPLIEKELAACRLKSSWLLRRARALILLGDSDAARADLTLALTEIESRMLSARPHPALLIDRATTLAFLGRTDDARRDYRAAQALDADPWQLRRVETALAGH